MPPDSCGTMGKWIGSPHFDRAKRVRSWAAALKLLTVLLLLLSPDSPHRGPIQPAQSQRSTTLAVSASQHSTWTSVPPAGELLHRKLHTSHYVRRGRYLSRVPYDSKTDASYQCCHLLLVSGDVELNPGPAPDGGNGAGTARNTLTLYHANVRSLKKQLGTLRTHAPVLQKYDIIAFSETLAKQQRQ